LQLKQLGYESTYWYGGNVTHGNFNQFVPANGFDHVMTATDFCAPDAPKTWVGVYDHVFLETTAKKIKEMDTNKPAFHFIYTTSNHGPYRMDLKNFGYDVDTVMPMAPAAVRNSQRTQKALEVHWYSDQALSKFIEDMKKTYPDSLIIVTGDHAHIPGSANKSYLAAAQRTDYTFREQFCTSFMMYHPDIDQEMLAGNTIGGHMNIMPTIMELIAPKGFGYYSLFPSLTKPIDHVVTPHHWLTRDAIGGYGKPFYQPLTVSMQEIPMLNRDNHLFDEETKAWCNFTGWFVRHPDKMEQAQEILRKS
jgi:phosphoglycerol transferase MdoB-like AlkP superfamily enzyme